MSKLGLPCRTIPGITEVIENRGLARQIRNIALEDLLGRMPIRLEQDQIASTLSGKTVLVTGAAGSIGSELCRQIARFSPASVVAFDLAETALFYLELEMRERFPLVLFIRRWEMSAILADCGMSSKSFGRLLSFMPRPISTYP